MIPDPRQTTAAQARTIIRHVSRRSRHGRTVRNRPCAAGGCVAETIDAKPALRPQSGHFGEIVRRGLIHPVQPIAPQQIRVRSPCEQRLKVRIVMREVVVRERDVAHPLRHVALVLLLERRLAVLPMAESEHFGEIASGDQSADCGPSEHLQVGIRRHVGLVHTRQTGVRLQRDLVETIGQEAVLVLQVLREHPEYLLRQVDLAHAIPVVERPPSRPSTGTWWRTHGRSPSREST